MDEGVARIQRAGLAAQAVAVAIGQLQVGHRVPAADVAPAAFEFHDRDVSVLFEHRVVDALGAAGGEGRLLQPKEAAVDRHRGGGAFAGTQDVGRMRAQCRQQRAGTHEEDARVPVVAAMQDQRLGHARRRLLDEARHGPAAAVGRYRSRLYVAIGGAGKARHHAEGDDPPRQRRIDAFAHGLREQRRVGNMVIGRREQQQVARLGQERRRSHGRRRVARHRFQDLPPGEARALDRFLHQEAVVFRRDAGDVVVQPREPLQREMQQALAAEQRRELLGQRLARKRPQARAAAAAQDHGMDGGVGVHDRPL